MRQQPSKQPLQNLHIAFDADDIDAVVRAFNSRSFSGKSPIIQDYEEVISGYFGVPHALACSNGTVAIELALRALGLGEGDRVALPPTAPVMTILPLFNLRCEPVFYDVAEDTFGPDLDDLERLARDGLAAVITVPMWGYPFDMAPVQAFCTAKNLFLIEDCAHAFGAHAGNGLFGTFGDVATFSTHERKLVSTGEGGFCLIRRAAVHERMKSWLHHGATWDAAGGYALGTQLGSNCKLPPLCAALGISQFEKLDRKIAARRERVVAVRSRLQSCPGLLEFQRFQGLEINGYAMVYWVHPDLCAADLGGKMQEAGIISDTVRYAYKPLYEEPAFRAFERRCPNAEKMISSILTIPCHEGLSEGDIRYIAETVHGLFHAGTALEQAS
ncbi:dTDP-4-amino-4,6-dideoxygalactose transaminase [Roseibium hamelinense]|uniref:dTDP-4-amino-4,6-dideoxygalactose transaminase n=1 Tax=Roseibium hamelinense TaxID=150831 RepID=A0A562T234_9HYPH|nr:DegT/DnrJ/EryC1/StrS family aminotransferase [Roseibium hamelinense]MTI44621.1 DegT/DnrJ/EryC1/StrS family aminotransferase [Roseibium hamelinense]TWI87248.1 dTDP-4-amino-4,6-dideoxygalactose transaminase [Roseibium hamelinense]